MASFLPLSSDITVMPDLENFHVLLIGCSINASDTDKMQKRKSETKDDNGLEGVNKDLENMEKFFRSKNVASITIKRPTGEEKQDILRKVANDSKGNLLIYYSGHGREGDGAWMIQNKNSHSEFISPSNLYSQFDKSNGLANILASLIFGPFVPGVAGAAVAGSLIYNLPIFANVKVTISSLFIISDSCFSGCFISALKSHENLIKKVVVFTSSSNDEVSYDSSKGGKYTLALIAKNKGENPDKLKNQTPWFHSVPKPKLIPIGEDKTIKSNNNGLGKVWDYLNPLKQF